MIIIAVATADQANPLLQMPAGRIDRRRLDALPWRRARRRRADRGGALKHCAQEPKGEWHVLTDAKRKRQVAIDEGDHRPAEEEAWLAASSEREDMQIGQKWRQLRPARVRAEGFWLQKIHERQQQRRQSAIKASMHSAIKLR